MKSNQTGHKLDALNPKKSNSKMSKKEERRNSGQVKRDMRSHANINDISVRSQNSSITNSNRSVQHIKFNGDMSLNILPEKIYSAKLLKRETGLSKSEKASPIYSRYVIQAPLPHYTDQFPVISSVRSQPQYFTPQEKSIQLRNKINLTECFSDKLKKEKLKNEDDINEFINESRKIISKSLHTSITETESPRKESNSCLKDEKLMKNAKKLIRQLQVFTHIKSDKKNWVAQTKKINLYSLPISVVNQSSSSIENPPTSHKEISLQCSLSKSSSQKTVLPSISRNFESLHKLTSFSANKSTQNCSLQEMYQKKVGTNKDAPQKSTIKNKRAKTLQELIVIRKQILKEKVSPKIINYSIQITPKKPARVKQNGSIDRLVKGEKIHISINQLLANAQKEHQHSKKKKISHNGPNAKIMTQRRLTST